MTGWRIGWIAAPQWIASLATNCRVNTHPALFVSQKAAEAAYTGPNNR
jgi:aspartate aminotransferase